MVPGRPRDDSVDDLVLTAALALMRDRGYGGLRIDDLVAQTGVAKTTMYRRWPSLAHLAVAAVERALGDRTVEPCADPAVELVRLLDRAFGSVAGDGALVATIGLDIARHDDPELHRLYRRRVIDPVRERVRELVADGMNGGALRAADPDAIALQFAQQCAAAGRKLFGDHSGFANAFGNHSSSTTTAAGLPLNIASANAST